MDLLNDIVEICNKEVKGEYENIIQQLGEVEDNIKNYTKESRKSGIANINTRDGERETA